jgi:hypothetical protein
MSLDAMKQALEALDVDRNKDHWEVARDRQRAITALRLAIEQAERQEPVAWREFDGEGGYDYRTYDDNENFRDEYIKRNGQRYASWVEPLYTAPPQQEKQGPVAHLWQHSETGRTRIVMPDQIITTDATWFVVGPLYLAPPQRQPLTEEEIDQGLLRTNYALQTAAAWRDGVRFAERAHGIGGGHD